MVDYIKKQIEIMEKMGADNISIMMNFKHKNNNKKYLVHFNIQEDDESKVEENGN